MRKWIVGLMTLFTGGVIGAICVLQTYKKKIQVIRKDVECHKRILGVYDQWIQTKQEGKFIKTYLETENFHNVAIYGIGRLGERLYAELKKSGIEIKYIIDKNVSGVYIDDTIIYKPNQQLPPVDVIIVTPVFYYEEIQRQLQEMNEYPVISLEDILYRV